MTAGQIKALIRKDLKKNFPQTVFSIKAYSNSWKTIEINFDSDNITESDVKKIVLKYDTNENISHDADPIYCNRNTFEYNGEQHSGLDALYIYNEYESKQRREIRGYGK